MHWYVAVSAALTFPFLKEVSRNCFVFDVAKFKKLQKSRRIASFWMLSSSKIEEVSQTCFVWIVNCQLGKMKKSRRIASFLTLSSSKIEEVSQNCFVFDVVNFEK